jgi:hypothetical protein
MIRKLIDVLTVIAMVVILVIFVMELIPTYNMTFNIFGANLYGY